MLIGIQGSDPRTWSLDASLHACCAHARPLGIMNSTGLLHHPQPVIRLSNGEVAEERVGNALSSRSG